jgi:ADP-ribosyl-[dinitrogen reductase] hydrolase
MKRTSATHPLQIAAVKAGPGFGRVGITFCPGKWDRHAMTGKWERDLRSILIGFAIGGLARL